MSVNAMTRQLPDPDYDRAFYDGVLPKRFFAWVIDASLIVAVLLLLSIVTAGIALVLWIPLHAGLAFLYRSTMLHRRSATLGMQVMAIELRGPAGAPLTRAQAMLHTGAYLVAATIFVIQLVSIGMMIARPYNRSLGDELVGSVMINRPA